PWKTHFVPIAPVTRTSYTNQGLTVGASYVYTVRAVGVDGYESRDSLLVHTRPRVLTTPIVSVLGPDTVEVGWNKHPAPDVVGYNVYRGVVSVRAVKKGTPAAWKDNDPEYAEPQPVEVRDVSRIQKLNDKLLAATSFSDRVNLADKGPEA